jgi:nitric oxide reductase NorQ protein
MNDTYYANGAEVRLFEQAYRQRLPVMLTGPTGCGKTRLVEHMGLLLRRPVVTISCHDDLTSSDLVGRFMVTGGDVVWTDGPLTRAVKAGAICYLDEVVEARQDTTVVIHPLTDHRRTLPLDKKGELIEAHKDFQLVISYNPGYQSLMKDLKQSTKQRFGALDFDYPEENIETDIVARESGVDKDIAAKLVQIAHRARNLKGHGLDEGISTRLLVYSGQLIKKGVEPSAACTMTMVTPLTDDPDMRDTLNAAVQTFFG